MLNNDEKHQMMEDLDEYQIMAWEQEHYLQILTRNDGGEPGQLIHAIE